jgi:3',5'-cyclic-AMP phosphodiesterase
MRNQPAKSGFLLALSFLVMVAFGACEKISRSDPFHGKVPDELTNLNERNLQRLNQNPPSGKPMLRVALISDSHYDYDRLARAIKMINEGSYDLVIHLGDLTQSGQFDEFLYAATMLQDLNAPCLCIPGNHDYLASGQSLFAAFFGEANNEIELAGVNFVLWDNTVWERSSETPDTKWLYDALQTNKYRTVVFSHQPPWSEQVSDTYGNLFKSLISQPNVLASIHGHNHDSSYGFLFRDNGRYAICGSTMTDVYSELLISETYYFFNTVEF